MKLSAVQLHRKAGPRHADGRVLEKRAASLKLAVGATRELPVTNRRSGSWVGRSLAVCLGVLVVLGITDTAAAQFEILRSEHLPGVFGGETKALLVLIRNPTTRAMEMPLKTRLYQLSSATRMPVGEAEPWKRLTVLGGQTVRESVRLKFPDVRIPTRYEVRWLDDADTAVGQTLVTVYPTNLLRQLADLAGDKPPGFFDPHEQLTPLLRTLQVEFDDLTEGDRLATWRGRLAILGPFDVRQAAPRELAKRVTEMVQRGVNVLLLSSNYERADSAVVICPVGAGRIVTAASELVAGLATQPLAQERLLELARLALAPNLPMIATEP